MPDYTLSKSKFLSGLQCARLVYAEVNAKETIPPPDLATQLLFEQGREVGEAARQQFPGGAMIQRFPWKNVEERTWEAIDNNVPYIFEPAFVHNQVMVFVDVLRRIDDNLYDIIEVKASTKVKDVHIPDLAIQRYVLEGAGLFVNRCILMHINNKYIEGEGGSLFTLEDVTERVEEFYGNLEETVEEMIATVDAPRQPEPAIGSHCDEPYECVLKERCWKNIPDLSVFDIPGLRKNKKWELYNENIIELDDLPAHYGLSHKQKLFMDSYRSGEPLIDKNAIREELSKLEEPLYFMDFETMNWAIPRYQGTKPYQQIPFQWSVHIRDGAKLEHEEFLWDNEKDPRPEFLRTLLEAIGPEGSVVVYNKGFEAGILKKLAEAYPEHKERIDGIVNRLWDQLDIFKNYYADAKFGGSNSIKSVLPIIVPELSYDQLDGVHDGTEAQSAYIKMIKGEEGLRTNLLKYCELDTKAMVDILEELEKL